MKSCKNGIFKKSWKKGRRFENTVTFICTRILHEKIIDHFLIHDDSHSSLRTGAFEQG